MTRLTAKLAEEARQQIIAIAGAQPEEGYEIVEEPQRFFEDFGVGYTKAASNVWVSEPVEEDGQKFQAYVWQHSQNLNIVFPVML